MRRMITDVLTSVSVAALCVGFVGYVADRVGMLF